MEQAHFNVQALADDLQAAHPLTKKLVSTLLITRAQESTTGMVDFVAVFKELASIGAGAEMCVDLLAQGKSVEEISAALDGLHAILMTFQGTDKYIVRGGIAQ